MSCDCEHHHHDERHHVNCDLHLRSAHDLQVLSMEKLLELYRGTDAHIIAHALSELADCFSNEKNE